MKCPDCDFESDSQRLLEIHAQATHVQDRIVQLAAEVKAGRRHGQQKDEGSRGGKRHGF